MVSLLFWSESVDCVTFDPRPVLEARSYSDYRSTYYEHVILHEVPEPFTLLLLGLGGAFIEKETPKTLNFSDRSDIVWGRTPSGVAEQGYTILYGKSQIGVGYVL